nr:FtsQ-type POTRA domain-containing protein [Hydrogenophilus thiooxidans]
MVVSEGSVAQIDPEQMVETVTQQVRGQALWEVDLIRIERQLKAFPVVDRVRVERVWPDRLVIELALRKAVLRWRNLDDGTWRWIDAQGRPFQDRLSPENGEGIWLAAHEAQLIDGFRNLRAIAPVLPNSLHLGGITLSPLGAITLTFVEPVEWMLGTAASPAAVKQRVAWLSQRWPQLVSRLGAMPTRVDVRHDQAFAVSLPPAPASEQDRHG